MKPRAPTRIATPRDLPYVLKLQRIFNHELGFITQAAAAQRITEGNLAIALENGEPAGFLLTAARLSRARHIRPIFQAAIQYDAQRRHHGFALLQLLTAAAVRDKQSIIQCHCRETLDANAFWKAAGFVAVALRDTNAVRGHPCILWRKPLVMMTAETLSVIPPNAHTHSGGGRSVGRHDWHAQALIEPFSLADVGRELERLNLAA